MFSFAGPYIADQTQDYHEKWVRQLIFHFVTVDVQKSDQTQANIQCASNFPTILSPNKALLLILQCLTPLQKLAPGPCGGSCGDGGGSDGGSCRQELFEAPVDNVTCRPDDYYLVQPGQKKLAYKAAAMPAESLKTLVHQVRAFVVLLVPVCV